MKTTFRWFGSALLVATVAFVIGCGGNSKPKPPRSGGADDKTITDDAPSGKTLTPAEAAKMEGKKVTVEMEVGFIYDGKERGTVFAPTDDFEKNATELGVFFAPESVKRFDARSGDELGDRYDKKKIRVTGTVSRKALDLFRENGKEKRVERLVIEATEPSQVSVVEK